MLQGCNISAEQVLDKISQDEIFNFALGYYPDLKKRYKSPFRPDTSPGCRFEWKGQYLYFIDNAGHKGKIFWTCFDLVQELFGISSFLRTCIYIWEKFDFKTNTVEYKKKDKTNYVQFKPIIKVKVTDFPENNYFTQYHIKADDLNKDPEVFNCIEYWCNSKKNLKVRKNPFIYPSDTVVYSVNGHFKLYFTNNKSFRWYTNCDIRDIFNYHKLKYFDKSKLVIITKSKKDAMILEYVFGLQVLALQNEGSFIPPDMWEEIKQFKTVFLFDNDEPGIQAVKKLSSFYETDYITLDKYNDTGEYIKNDYNGCKNFFRKVS